MTRTLTLCLAVATLLAGCGSGSKQSEASPKARAPAATKSANPGNTVSANMVSAVALNKTTGAPVEVRFELKDRPQSAHPVDVDLVIVPLSASVDRVVGKVQAEDGLDLIDGAEIPPSDRPPEGVPIRHTIRVQPKQDGIFMFSAVLSVDAAGQTSTQTFSIPVISGAGMPDLPAPGAGDTRAGTAGTAPSSSHTSASLAAAKSGGAAAAQ